MKNGQILIVLAEKWDNDPWTSWIRSSMRRYLLDTSAAGDWIDRRGATRDRVREMPLGGHVIGTCTPVLAELWAGVESSQSREFNTVKLRHAVAQFTEWPLTTNAANVYGRLYTDLRRRRRKIGSNDLRIASIVLTLPRCIVVSRDSDPLDIPGLKIENWFS